MLPRHLTFKFNFLYARGRHVCWLASRARWRCPTLYNWLATGIEAVLSHGCDSISIIFSRVNVYVSFLSDAPVRRASISSIQWLQCGGGCCSKVHSCSKSKIALLEKLGRKIYYFILFGWFCRSGNPWMVMFITIQKNLGSIRHCRKIFLILLVNEVPSKTQYLPLYICKVASIGVYSPL